MDFDCILLFFIISGDELLSDSFPYKEIQNGCLWEVEGKVCKCLVLSLFCCQFIESKYFTSHINAHHILQPKFVRINYNPAVLFGSFKFPFAFRSYSHGLLVLISHIS